jgi:hypothetical protein
VQRVGKEVLSVDASNVAIDLTTEVVCAHRSSSEENSSNA